MISLLCQKTTSGVISTSQDDQAVFNLNQLLNDNDVTSIKSAETNSSRKKMPKSIKSAPLSITSSRSNPKVGLNRSVSFDPSSVAFENYYQKHPFRRLSSNKLRRVQNWIDEKMSEDPTVRDYYNELNELLSQEEQIRREIDESIERCERSRLCRKELLYKNWYINVYEPIQVEIYRNMNGHKANFAEFTRDLKYAEYLDKVNQRGCAYGEDFAPEDYDPTSVVKVDANLAKKLNDPTNLPKRKTFNEEKTILNAQHGKIFSIKQIERHKLPIITNDSQSRTDLTWNDWLSHQFIDVNSTARTRSAQRCKPNRISSELNFNWNNEERSSEQYCGRKGIKI